MATLTHKQGIQTIVSYSAMYDDAGRLSQVHETGPGVSATTTYTYDDAGRLLSENRTGTSPYASSYTYNSRGLRATAFRSEGGVASHDGTYLYDDAGRLTQVTDAVASSGLGGSYTWNPDGTLASYPGPGYTRRLEYDEEGRLKSITRDYASQPDVVAYEYGYGFDGQRRWRKDNVGGAWDWYPCGVACGAGELVEMRSTDGGQTWQASALLLEGPTGIVSRGGEFHLPDLSGAYSRITNASGSVLASRGFDGFGEQRAASGSVTSPYGSGSASDESLRNLKSVTLITGTVASVSLAKPDKRDGPYEVCKIACSNLLCPGQGVAGMVACDLLCAKACKGYQNRADDMNIYYVMCARTKKPFECCNNICRRFPPGGRRDICIRNCEGVYIEAVATGVLPR